MSAGIRVLIPSTVNFQDDRPLDKQNADLIAENKQLTDRISDLTASNASLQEEIPAYYEITYAEPVDAAGLDVSALRSDITELVSENRRLQNQLLVAAKQREEFQEEHHRVRIRYADVLSAQRRETDQLRKEKEELSRRNDKLVEQLKIRDEKISSYKRLLDTRGKQESAAPPQLRVLPLELPLQPTIRLRGSAVLPGFSNDADHDAFPSSATLPPQARDYIMSSTWLREPAIASIDSSSLRAAEEAIIAHQPQRALIVLDKYLITSSTPKDALPPCTPASGSPSPALRPSTTTHTHINALLLKSCILRIFDVPAPALQLTESAVRLAHDAGLWALVAKAQMYRGLCLLELKRWRHARLCFVRAAGVRGFEGRVRGWGERAWAEERREGGGEEGEAEGGFETVPGVREGV